MGAKDMIRELEERINFNRLPKESVHRFPKSNKMMATKEESPSKPVPKPDRYNRNVLPSSLKPPDVIKDVVLHRYRQRPTMPTSSVPYSSVIGENIPVKRAGHYVKKDTGLLVAETRGRPEKN